MVKGTTRYLTGYGENDHPMFDQPPTISRPVSKPSTANSATDTDGTTPAPDFSEGWTPEEEATQRNIQRGVDRALEKKLEEGRQESKSRSRGCTSRPKKGRS